MRGQNLRPNQFARMKEYVTKAWSWGRSKKRCKILKNGENPYLDEASAIVAATPHWDDFFSLPTEKRDWVKTFDKYCNKLSVKYAWACPDERAIRIIKQFSPLVEIGAGRGYWAAMLQNAGADVLPFDKFVAKRSLNWCNVDKGGPEVIDIMNKSPLPSRNLFLCYPDEDESIAVQCLEKYKGEYIIHVGELAISDTKAGAPQAPFGRTSSAEFQCKLQASYHCLLVMELQMRLPYSKDCLTVWKRTDYVEGKDEIV